MRIPIIIAALLIGYAIDHSVDIPSEMRFPFLIYCIVASIVDTMEWWMRITKK